MNKEIEDALHMLLHCSLKDTEYETQVEQYKIVRKYITNLQQKNEQLKDTIYKVQVLIRHLKTTEWGMYGYDLLDLIQNILDEKDISNELLEIEMLKGELK